MSSLPTVAHIMRTYLAPTETFIGNQIFTLRRVRPLVLCHHRKDNASYPFSDVFCATELLKGLPRVMDGWAYRLFRKLTSSAARQLAKVAQDEQSRVLHFHYLVDARFFLPLKKQLSLPSVVSGYGYDVSSFPNQWGGYGRRYLQPIFHEMDLFLAMSEDMKRDLLKLGCPEEKIRVHYYGADMERFAFPERKYEEKKILTILACGTLEEKKAQHLVLQALQRVETSLPQGSNFQLRLVGDGPMRGKLERQVETYGWQDRVRFAGHVPHHDPALVQAYREADIFVLPSVTMPDNDKEGIPGTIIEAMASGLPVVSTYHAGIPEVITSGEDGLLTPERDIPALAHALSRLLADRDLRERLGRKAAMRALTQYNLKAKTQELEQIYDTLGVG